MSKHTFEPLKKRYLVVAVGRFFLTSNKVKEQPKGKKIVFRGLLKLLKR